MAKNLFASHKAKAFPAAGQLKEVAKHVAKKKTVPGKEQTKGTGKGTGKAAGKGLSAEGQKKAQMTLKMNKTLGQHLLKNPGIVKKIIEAADIKKSDLVLEIGPGTGNLTVQLCQLAKKVRALEIDPRMVAEVRRRCLTSGVTNLEVVQGDALKTDFGAFQVCTANLPYQISSPFVFRLLSLKQPFRCAVLMFQKEFGERLLARPGEKLYCRLAVNVQLFCRVTRVCGVDRKSFNPPPKVDSVVVKLVPQKRDFEIDYAQWDTMLRIIFTRKHKTLGAIFAQKKVAEVLHGAHKAAFLLHNKQPVEDFDKFREHLSNFLKTLPTNTDANQAAQAEAPAHFYSEQRGIALTILDFAHLLISFNCNGLFFPVTASKKSVCSRMGIEAQDIPASMFMEDDSNTLSDGAELTS